MKRFLFFLLVLGSAAMSGGMTEAEFKTLYENPNKDAEACYKLYKAYTEGDGVAKNDSQARKWILEAHTLGMISTRKEIAKLPWRNKLPFDKRKPDITIKDPGDDVAKELGIELVRYCYRWYLGREDYGTAAPSVNSREVHLTSKEMARVRQLIADGADLNVTYAGTHPGGAARSALSLAVSSGDFETAQLLIDHGADPSANGNLAIINSLSITRSGEAFERQLRLNEEYAHPEWDMLELPRLDTEAEEKGKNDPQARKKAKRKRDKLCKTMRKAFAKKGGTAYYPQNDLLPPANKLMRCEKRMLRALEFIGNSGADLKIWDDMGYSLAYRIGGICAPYAFPLLVEKGLDINQPQNPAEVVPAASDPKAVSYMVELGHVRERDVALNHVVANGQEIAVDIMLKLGADPNAQTGREQKSAEEVACMIRDRCTDSAYAQRYTRIINAIKRSQNQAAPSAGSDGSPQPSSTDPNTAE